MNIPQERLALLNSGKAAANNLAESLAVDFAALLSAARPDMPATALCAMEQGASLGIVKRMWLAGELLHAAFGPAIVPALAVHSSDTVRGWACFVLSLAPMPSLAERMEAVRAFADDRHFGVREWAWLAMRSHIAENVEEAIALLSPWTAAPSERVRRFATESTRPRGVWCAHIECLKHNPALALPLLEPLRADSSAYVQDSVANWLNDASKTQPEWVRELCARWSAEAPGKATERICKRALRSINK